MDELLKSEMTKIKGFLMDVRFAMFLFFFNSCYVRLDYNSLLDLMFFLPILKTLQPPSQSTDTWGGVSFSIQKFILQILGTLNRSF